MRRCFLARSFQDIFQHGVQIGSIKIGIACLNSQPPTNRFAAYYVLTIWTVRYPAQPALLQFRHNRNQIGWHMGKHMTVSAFSFAALMNPEPSRLATVPLERLRHKPSETPSGLRHAFQRYASRLPVNCNHAVERQANGIGMSHSVYEIADVRGA
ncbi:hypothetical protein CP98_05071 [Sphingobium yanoikuyae]|uniref:Uncharacterized protein n=1 Tax=Sphingobium yanoikuyae TaxID=13690 RepID=A0A084E4I1_SPHYA|nr:hypothetical protein CP98_05071 [Sphingobium yanoikuyae]